MRDRYGNQEQMQNPFAEMLTAILPEWMKDNIRLSIPGHVRSFNPTTQIAEVQIGVKRERKSGERYAPNPIANVPVMFNGSNTHTVEFRVEEGTEGMIEFSHRAIGGWIEQGGIADADNKITFSGTDAVFLPGIRSKPGAIPNFANDGIRIRAISGEQHVWLKSDGTGELKASSWAVHGPATFHDHATFVQDATFSAGIFNGGKSIGAGHGHTNVQNGTGTSGGVA